MIMRIIAIMAYKHAHTQKHEHKHALWNLNYRKEERCRYGSSYENAQVHEIPDLSSTRAGRTFGLLGEE